MSGHMNKSQSVRNADLWYRQWVRQKSRPSFSRGPPPSSGDTRSAASRRTNRESHIAKAVAAASTPKRDSIDARFVSPAGHADESDQHASHTQDLVNARNSTDVETRVSTVEAPVPQLVDLAQEELRKRWLALEGTPTRRAAVPTPAVQSPPAHPGQVGTVPNPTARTTLFSGSTSPSVSSVQTAYVQTPPRRPTESPDGNTRSTPPSEPRSSAKIAEALLHMKRLLEAGALTQEEFEDISKQILEDEFLGGADDSENENAEIALPADQQTSSSEVLGQPSATTEDRSPEIGASSLSVNDLESRPKNDKVTTNEVADGPSSSTPRSRQLVSTQESPHTSPVKVQQVPEHPAATVPLPDVPPKQPGAIHYGRHAVTDTRPDVASSNSNLRPHEQVMSSECLTARDGSNMARSQMWGAVRQPGDDGSESLQHQIEQNVIDHHTATIEHITGMLFVALYFGSAHTDERHWCCEFGRERHCRGPICL